MSKNILIIGATSSIARSLANQFAQQGSHLYLASRDVTELERIANDIHIRYQTPIDYSVFDAEDLATHDAFWQQVLSKMPTIDGLLFASGYMGNPDRHQDFAEQKKVIDTNFTGAVSIINIAVQYFAQQQQSGFILVLSSVAGDRGRQGYYVYNASKAALTVYLQGLRNRYFSKGVRILTIKLGLVDTAMVYGLPRAALGANPNKVATKIMRLLNSNNDESYVPGFWRYIMLIVKLIPEKIFKRLKL